MTYTRKKTAEPQLNEESDSIENREQSYKTPSWFTQEPIEESENIKQEISQAEQPNTQPYFETPNSDAYDAYRRRMEQRFKEGQTIYDRPKSSASPANLQGPQQRRPTLPLHEINSQRRLYELEQEGHLSQQKSQLANSLPLGRMFLMGTAAVFIGTLAGLGFSNIDLINQKYHVGLSKVQQTIAFFMKPAPVAAKAQLAHNLAHETVIIKKAVATATLDVADVKGTLGTMIPLMLSAQSADSTEPLSLKISGLPDQAYLTAGVKSAQGSWTLKQSEISDVKLVVPQSDLKQFDMEVAAVEDNTGDLAAPIKAINVQLGNSRTIANAPVTQVGEGKSNVDTSLSAAIDTPAVINPVNAAPDTASIKLNEPSAIPVATTEAADFVTKGNALLAGGDIISARQFFLRASELGNAQGSFGVAQSYDPKVFAQLNVVGLQPDPAQAADWYKKAAKAGVVAATQ